MNSIFAKRIRSTIESAKQDLDLARQQRTTSATLRQCNIVNAIQVTKAFVEAVDSGVRLPGEIVASVVFSRPMSDIDAINWWLVLAEELRKAFPNRIKGSSGKLDYPRYLKNERGEQMGRDGKPLKMVKTKHKGPDGKTYFGCKLTGELATDRDNMDEAMLLEVERRKAEDWSNLFRLLLEAVEEHVPPAASPIGANPVDDETAKAAQYAALLVSVKSLADGSLKGIQRRVTVLLVEAGGTKAIADIATDRGVGWLAPFKGSVDGYLKGVRPKLQPLGCDVKPFDQELRLVLQAKPTRPRRSTKKAAPPKRRQSAASLPPKRR